jgi:hypothetical protein
LREKCGKRIGNKLRNEITKNVLEREEKDTQKCVQGKGIKNRYER